MAREVRYCGNCAEYLEPCPASPDGCVCPDDERIVIVTDDVAIARESADRYDTT